MGLQSITQYSLFHLCWCNTSCLQAWCSDIQYIRMLHTLVFSKNSKNMTYTQNCLTTGCQEITYTYLHDVYTFKLSFPTNCVLILKLYVGHAWMKWKNYMQVSVMTPISIFFQPRKKNNSCVSKRKRINWRAYICKGYLHTVHTNMFYTVQMVWYGTCIFLIKWQGLVLQHWIPREHEILKEEATPTFLLGYVKTPCHSMWKDWRRELPGNCGEELAWLCPLVVQLPNDVQEKAVNKRKYQTIGGYSHQVGGPGKGHRRQHYWLPARRKCRQWMDLENQADRRTYS